MSDARLKRLFWAVLLFGCVLRAGFLLVRPIGSIEEMGHRRGDEKYYYSIAQGILDHGEYTESNLKAYRPPGYPAFLALNMAVFGRDTRVVQVEQNLFYVGAAALFSLAVAEALGGVTALLTLLLLMTNPMWLFIPQEAYSDTLFQALFALGLFCYLKALRRSDRRWALGAGLAFGASALMREIGLYFGLFLVLYAFWEFRKAHRSAIGSQLAGLIVGGMAACILPWTVRNYIVFRSFVPLTTNSTINLYMGNNPKANGDFKWALPEGMEAIWNTPSPHGANELRVYKASAKASVEYVETHPAHMALLDLKKAVMMWSPIPVAHSDSALDRLYRLYRFGLWVPFFPLAVYGLWLLRRNTLGHVIFGVCLIGMGIHVLTYFGSRYRAPYEFLLTAPAAYALTWLFFKRKAEKSETPERADAPVAGVP
jgi:4-amino-4-deoxy-L-arabinose transferase-like glycosyltransferase